MAVGLYSPLGALFVVAAGVEPRLPRARPEPRALPKPNAGEATFSWAVGFTAAGGALFVSAEATFGSPDVSDSDMTYVCYG
jgi:hypothetical protein